MAGFMKVFLEYLRKFSLLFGAGLGAFVVCATILSVLYIPAKPQDCSDKVTVYLQHNLVHADFVLPIDSLSAQTREQIKLPIDSDYLVFGLGDRDIYVHTPTWWDLKVRYALKALFLPSDRAVHVEPARGVSENWIGLEICDSQLSTIEDYIMSTFSRDDEGGVMMMEGLSYSGLDRFYRAKGTYSLFNSCNNWANGAMKKAGLRAPVWSPFAQGITYQAQRQKSAK